MLEKDVIQYRGFHNVEENGQVTGFQLCVRSDYYRGVWLSQLRPGRVIVDGDIFPRESIIWCINGKDYTVQEMAVCGTAFWRVTDAALLKIKKPGGLSQGFHDVTVRFGASCSYMPPAIDTFDDNTEYNTFSGGTYTRKHMCIV